MLRNCYDAKCTCSHQRLLDCIREGFNDAAKLIIKNLDICHLADCFGLTYLHYSAVFGNSVMVQHLIDEGCNINAQTNYGQTPLILAVKRKLVNTAKVLIKNNADIHLYTDNTRMSSLGVVFYYMFYSTTVFPNEMLLMKIFIDKINKDFLIDTFNTTKFLLSTDDSIKLGVVVFGKVYLSSFLLKNGYSLEYRELLKDRSALDCTILHANYENTKLLIEHGANINAKNKFQCMPLEYYTVNWEGLDYESKSLEYLLTCAMSDVSLSDRTKRKDVEHLLVQGNKRTVRTVLKFGIDLSERFTDGECLLHLLIRNKNVDVIDLLDELDIKFEVNSLTLYGNTALQYAANYSCFKNVKFLLKHGADINRTSPSGHSALSLALRDNSERNFAQRRRAVKIVKLLLKRGADANVFGRSIPYDIDLYTDKSSRKVFIAHLAMLGVLGKLNDSTRNEIQPYSQFESYFNHCKKQLEEMRTFQVYKKITLFRLLTESDKKIVLYARNQEFLLAFKSTMKKMTHLESYYCNSLKKLVAKSKKIVKLEPKAALAFEDLTGLRIDAYYNIVCEIFSYLNRKELKNLCKVNKKNKKIKYL